MTPRRPANRAVRHSHKRHQNRHRKRWTKHDFTFGSVLGRGRFGTVYKAKEINSGRVYAIKVIEKREITKGKLQDQLTREIRCHRQLTHPNVLPFYDYFYDSKHIYFVLQYAPKGNLYDYCRQQGLTETQLAKVIHSVARALYYCHQKEVVHRDIKPENILLMQDLTPKVGDFGWCDYAPKPGEPPLYAHCGTVDYLSPEMLNSHGYDERIDIWALGVMIYDLISGAPPFENTCRKETRQRIRTMAISYQDTPISATCQDLLERVFRKDPSKRIGLREFLQHPWFQVGNDNTINE